MTAQRIILLRHAEKARPDEHIQGVDARGQPDANELSVRGWQRAGALAHFFAPGGGDLGVPDALFAGPPTAAHPSRRSVSSCSRWPSAWGGRWSWASSAARSPSWPRR